MTHLGLPRVFPHKVDHDNYEQGQPMEAAVTVTELVSLDMEVRAPPPPPAKGSRHNIP